MLVCSKIGNEQMVEQFCTALQRVKMSLDQRSSYDSSDLAGASRPITVFKTEAFPFTTSPQNLPYDFYSPFYRTLSVRVKRRDVGMSLSFDPSAQVVESLPPPLSLWHLIPFLDVCRSENREHNERGALSDDCDPEDYSPSCHNVLQICYVECHKRCDKVPAKVAEGVGVDQGPERHRGEYGFPGDGHLRGLGPSVPVAGHDPVPLLLADVPLRFRIVGEEPVEHDAPDQRQRAVNVEHRLPSEAAEYQAGAQDGDHGAERYPGVDDGNPHALLLEDDPLAHEDVHHWQVRGAQHAREEPHGQEQREHVSRYRHQQREDRVGQHADQQHIQRRKYNEDKIDDEELPNPIKLTSHPYFCLPVQKANGNSLNIHGYGISAEYPRTRSKQLKDHFGSLHSAIRIRNNRTTIKHVWQPKVEGYEYFETSKLDMEMHVDTTNRQVKLNGRCCDSLVTATVRPMNTHNLAIEEHQSQCPYGHWTRLESPLPRETSAFMTVDQNWTVPGGSNSKYNSWTKLVQSGSGENWILMALLAIGAGVSLHLSNEVKRVWGDLDENWILMALFAIGAVVSLHLSNEVKRVWGDLDENWILMALFAIGAVVSLHLSNEVKRVNAQLYLKKITLQRRRQSKMGIKLFPLDQKDSHFCYIYSYCNFRTRDVKKYKTIQNNDNLYIEKKVALIYFQINITTYKSKLLWSLKLESAAIQSSKCKFVKIQKILRTIWLHSQSVRDFGNSSASLQTSIKFQC
ncbi:hypothetical protein WN51_10253 [Melipona quadrifasciata]|uniref:Uncharacterized protein n=1 Tax=Melipona quadrifasciata TaxID=166423 RepID=A0A0M9A6W6_9HYME|nr:hypothetical protein WN51_10253 [Melipona quadrifasciata]